MEVSKHLISKILNMKIYSCGVGHDRSGTILWINEEGKETPIIMNVYEFTSTCKKWSLDYGVGYCITSFLDFDGTWFANVSGSVKKKSFSAETEPEAILKACQWIVDLEHD